MARYTTTWQGMDTSEPTQGAHAKGPTRFAGAPVCSPQEGLGHFCERKVDTASHVARTGRVRRSELLFHC